MAVKEVRLSEDARPGPIGGRPLALDAVVLKSAPPNPLCATRRFLKR